MKTGYSAKMLSLVLLGIASSLVTSAVMARVRPKRSAVAPAANPSGIQATRYDRSAGEVPPATPNNSAGAASIQWLKVFPLANGIRVAGQAHIVESRPKARFVWSIIVRERPSGRVLFEKRYDTQVFQVPEQEVTPTFDDTVSPGTPPGTYSVELVLYEVPAKGVAVLDDADAAKTFVYARAGTAASF